MGNLLCFISIIVTVISIFAALISQDLILSIILMFINLFLLISIVFVITPIINRFNTYKNVIKNNRYFSLLYMNYIDLYNPNIKCKVEDLKVRIELNIKDNIITDTRFYTFSCKSNSESNNIVLSFLNETGDISAPEYKINSKSSDIQWDSVGKDSFFKSSRDILRNVNIQLYDSKMQQVELKYSISYEQSPDRRYIYVFYPKLFFHRENNVYFEIHVNDEKDYVFQIKCINANTEKRIGFFSKEDGFYHWKGKVNKNHLYVIKGERRDDFIE